MQTHGEFRARRHFGSLDGFRAICIVGVVWHHTQPFVHRWPIGARGFLGVDAFFVLSGFLIVTLLLREREQSGTISLKKFWARRSLRIFPLYYGIVLALIALGLVRPGSEAGASAVEAAPYLLTYTANWVGVEGLLAVTWSLCSEEQFYAFWPLVERFTPRIAWPVLLIAIALNLALGLGLFDDWLGPLANLEVVDATFAPILFGVGLAHLLHHRRSYEPIARLLGHRAAAPLALLATLGLVALPIDLDLGLRFVIQLMITLTFAAMLVQPKHYLAGLFDHPLVVRLGLVSYGLYLLHMFVDHGARKITEPLGDPMGLRFVIVLLAGWLVAELSYRFFERPFLKLKKRFSTVAR